jgi:plastocyanin
MKFALGAGSALAVTVVLAASVAAQSPAASPMESPAASPVGSTAASPAASLGDITNVAHPAHIHTGSCANLGDIVAPLNDVALVGGSDRVGASVTPVDMKIADILASPHAIMAHASAENLGAYIACADLKGDPSAKQLVVALDQQNNSGFAGVAFLEEVSGKTEVDLSLTAPIAGSQAAGSPEPASSPTGTMPPMSMAPSSSAPSSLAPSSGEPAGGSPAASSQSVTIQNLSFQPNALTVPVGTTVTWTNNDSTQHTVTADDGSFDSGVLQQGATFSQTFTTAGTFSYHCNIHSTMRGTITVQ